MNIQIFEKIIELITPSFNRQRYQARHLRLKLFFEERERINKLNEPEEVKKILLNSAVSALTGTKYADIAELEYFLDRFNAYEFEVLYWAFVWNRLSYQVVKNSKGKILRLKILKSGKRKVVTLNIFVLIAMFGSPLAFYLERDGFISAFNSLFGLSQSILHIIFWIICLVCGVTIIKVFYDWTHWSELNKILED